MMLVCANIWQQLPRIAPRSDRLSKLFTHCHRHATHARPDRRAITLRFIIRRALGDEVPSYALLCPAGRELSIQYVAADARQNPPGGLQPAGIPPMTRGPGGRFG